MSLRAMTWALDQNIKPMEKLVLVTLSDHTNPENRCWPSQELLAKRCGISRESVSRIIKSLVSKDMLKIEHRRTDSGRMTSNVYYLNLDNHVTEDHMDHVTKDHTVCDGGSHGPCDGGSHKPGYIESPKESSRRGSEKNSDPTLKLELVHSEGKTKTHSRLEVFEQEYLSSTGSKYLVGDYAKEGGAAKRTVAKIPDETLYRRAVRAYLAANDERIIEANWPFMWFIKDLNRWAGKANTHGADTGKYAQVYE